MWHVPFDIGGWVFWTLTGLGFILLVSSLFNTSWRLGVGTIVSYAGAILLFSSFDASCIVVAIKAISWMAILKFVGFYILAGFLWAVFYWYLHASRLSRNLLSLKSKWCEQNGIPVHMKMSEVPLPLRSVMYKHINDGINHGDEDNLYTNGSGYLEFDRMQGENSDQAYSDRINSAFALAVFPMPSKNKARIAAWMSAWPVSLLWWMLGDLLVNFWGHLCRASRKVFMWVSLLAFRRFNKQF
jgi:hypothetical protein